MDHCLKEKNITGLMKDELDAKITTKLVGLSRSYSLDDSSQDKKSKGTKRCVIKRKHKFEDSDVELRSKLTRE